MIEKLVLTVLTLASSVKNLESEFYLSVLLCRQSVSYRRPLYYGPTGCRAWTCSSAPWGLFEYWPEEQTNNDNLQQQQQFKRQKENEWAAYTVCTTVCGGLGFWSKLTCPTTFVWMSGTETVEKWQFESDKQATEPKYMKHLNFSQLIAIPQSVHTCPCLCTKLCRAGLPSQSASKWDNVSDDRGRLCCACRSRRWRDCRQETKRSSRGC